VNIWPDASTGLNSGSSSYFGMSRCHSS
jgi:hypothetical protein